MPRRRDPDEITRSFRINRHLWDRAKTRADERNESLSEVIRRYLERYSK
jgi:predicted CopG family antitoxin